MKDTITIFAVDADALLGVYPSEQRERQPIVLDLSFPCSANRAAQSDQLVCAVGEPRRGDCKPPTLPLPFALDLPLDPKTSSTTRARKNRTALHSTSSRGCSRYQSLPMISPLSYVICLGLLEGLTEFFPISSSGHIMLANLLLGSPSTSPSSFEIALQMGAHVATALYFWSPGWRLFGLHAATLFPSSPVQFPFHLGHICLGLAPSLLVGTTLHLWIEPDWSTSAHLILGWSTGTLLLAEARRRLSNNAPTAGASLSLSQALTVGLWQCFSFFPGVSRLATTLCGGILCGVSQTTSLYFSFALAIPVTMGACALSLVSGATPSDLPAQYWLTGTALSFLISLLVVPYAFALLQRTRFSGFLLYRMALILLLTYWYFTAPPSLKGLL